MFRNKLMLGLMVVAVEVTAGTEAGVETVVNNPTQPSTLQNIYNGVAARLNQAKKAAANLFFADTDLDNVPKGLTIPQAFLLVQQLINNEPKDKTALDKYWKAKSSLFLSCAKLLPEATEKQILKALQEIDKRLLYWLYQKDHQWQYFFSKNPLKWVMGKNQDVEIETNIEQLQTKQDELYIRLGGLSTIDWHQYLIAMNNYQAAYAWIKNLLDIVSGVRQEAAQEVSSDSYDALVTQLYQELKKVGARASVIMSELEATAMPYHITRNWVNYGALMMASRWAYNSKAVADLVASLPQKATDLQATFAENVGYMRDFVNKTFFGISKKDKDSDASEKGVDKLSDLSKDLLVKKATQEETKKVLEDFLKQSVKEGVVFSGTPAAEEAVRKNILDAFDKGDTGPFENFFYAAMGKVSPTSSQALDYLKSGFLAWALAVKGAVGGNIEQVFAALLDKVEEDKKKLERETEGVRNVALLTPAALALGVGYTGLSSVYGRFTKSDYTPIRLALLAILSLFVDTAKPLDDLEYGKMIFLLYNLKERAKKELPVKGNVRVDFIKDLEKVESREFDSAAKRRIIKDMFKKYSFLGLVQ